ncbi:Coq4 family protein [Cyanobium sp. Morenito 9A2]|uniref:Coq4 family protein n=1 Tax=Cyanobium sp. Morenito 9A2 TaxID=2823718 RepID=UPI0020CC1213|nr:Coq4 family protein [Cyanobium sp. Morenito 9A2]MCP9850851.1 ubiquinone biosynthesis protein [Cyanobium sp. Morenito 9A2]
MPGAIELLNLSYDFPYAEAGRARLKAEPAVAALVRERYWGPWPTIEELARYPKGSLAAGLGRHLITEGLGLLPKPAGIGNLSDDDQYLQLRIRATHDLWHVVTGCPTNLAGDVAINGIGARQLYHPGAALLICADLLSRSRNEPAQPDLAEAIAHGLRLGGHCAPLLAQRWEEGWGEPLTAWRDRLGISALLADSPFADGLTED